jgi:hypothetical protein
MPVERCSDSGKPGFRFGDSGKCYTYTQGDQAGMRSARDKARAQERAAYASGFTGKSYDDTEYDFLNEFLLKEEVSTYEEFLSEQSGNYDYLLDVIKEIGYEIVLPTDDQEEEGQQYSNLDMLNPQERMFAASLIAVTEKYGKFKPNAEGVWVGYESAEENDDSDIGVKCANCVFFKGEGVCMIVEENIESEGKCRLAVIPDGRVAEESDDKMEDEEMEDSEEDDEYIPELSDRQNAQYVYYEKIADRYGKWGWGTGERGAHYSSEEENPFKEKGLVCSNCVFFEGGQKCEIVDGQIHPDAICKLWIIPENLLQQDDVEKVTYGRPGPNDPRKTPAKPSERRRGSSRNRSGSAESGSSVSFSDAVTRSLKTKMDAHNEKHGDAASKRATMAALKAVYRRGAGAFSTSHRPGMTRGQWAMARVNAYLYLLRNGRPSNPNYNTDNDLLPKGHPRSSKK